MPTSLGPIRPDHPGAPSRVIQGCFPSGRPTILPPGVCTAGGARSTAITDPDPDPGPPRFSTLSSDSDRPSRHRYSSAIATSRSTPTTDTLPNKFPAGAGALQPATAIPAQVPHPILPQSAGARPQALEPRSAAPRGPVVQRIGNGEAFQLSANLSNFGGVGGQPLPDPVRQKMESFFNASSADVRVHVGSQATSIGALAFTQGSNLYFAPGQYEPTITRGLQLLGHELTHVVQQRAGSAFVTRSTQASPWCRTGAWKWKRIGWASMPRPTPSPSRANRPRREPLLPF